MEAEDVVDFLIAAGNCAPSADNMQPWCFRREGADLVLAYDHRRFPDSMFPFDHQATLLSMGAVVENLSLAWTELGMQNSLEASVPLSAPYDFLRMPLGPSPVQVTHVRSPWQSRHTNRLPFRRSAPLALSDMQIEAAASDAVRVRVIQDRNEIKQIARLVRSASEIRFRTREIHEWFSQSLRFTPAQVATGDGLDVATFDLPPGGRTFLKLITSSWRNMQRFNLAGGFRLMAAVEASSITRAGAILAICGPAGSAGAFAAGRRMQALWIKLNAAGLAVQPYYVISDQLTRLANGKTSAELSAETAALHRHAESLFHLEQSTTLHLLLRVGEPVKQPTRALRLPPSHL